MMSEFLCEHELICRARAGAEIGMCDREAVETAAINRIDVSFVHNGRTYKVRIADLLDCVKEVASNGPVGGGVAGTAGKGSRGRHGRI